MKTKQRILQTALQLFNEQGLAKVSLRTIASSMGISQGNLNYHFKKRADIIEGLYMELVDKMNVSMERLLKKPMEMEVLFHNNYLTFLQLYEYRFLMLDFVQVMRAQEEIRKHYQQLQQGRMQQFAVFVNLFQQMDWIRKEEFEEEYARLYRRMNIMGDFWISYAEIAEGRVEEKQIREYSVLLAENLYPYLTVSGKAAFEEALTSFRSTS